MVSDKFRASARSEFCTTAAVVPVYWFSSPKAVSQRAKTLAFGRRKHGEFAVNMGIYLPYQERQRILIPIYLSQQFTNYNAHQFAKQSYRPELLKDELVYQNFIIFLLNSSSIYSTIGHTCTIAITSEHRNNAGRTESQKFRQTLVQNISHQIHRRKRCRIRSGTKFTNSSKTLKTKRSTRYELES